MITKLYVESYRGIHDLDLGELGKVNIIAGANNTGKTSLLEIIQSLKAPCKLQSWRLVGKREENDIYRATNVYDTMKTLFPVDTGIDENVIKYQVVNDGEEYQIELVKEISEVLITEKQLDEATGWLSVGRGNAKYNNMEYEAKVMEIQYKINGELSGEDLIYSIQTGIGKAKANNKSIVENIVYISPTQHARNTFFLDAVLKNPELYEQFVDIMRQFDPYFLSINSIEEGAMGRKYVVLSKNHSEGLLLNAYGDGMKKAMLLLSAVIRAQNGILLLDEFETAIHVSAMENVFRWILKIAEQLNVQIFMTSHSIEAIKTVLKCYPELQHDIRMLTLVKVQDKLKVRNVDGEKAVQLADEYGLELR